MASDPYWNPLVPELTVRDLTQSLAFYAAAGFTTRFRRDAPPFAYLELGQAQLMLEQEHGGGWATAALDRPLGRGINLQIEVPDAGAVWQALAARKVMAFRPLRDTWYATSATQEEGQREFLVQDPDGYLLRFAQVLGCRPLHDGRA